MEDYDARSWAAEAARQTKFGDYISSFARMLRTRVNEAICSTKIRMARAMMAEQLADPGFRQAYVSNIAMLLHDKYGLTGFIERNSAAEDILDLVFGKRFIELWAGDNSLRVIGQKRNSDGIEFKVICRKVNAVRLLVPARFGGDLAKQIEELEFKRGRLVEYDICIQKMEINEGQYIYSVQADKDSPLTYRDLELIMEDR